MTEEGKERTMGNPIGADTADKLAGLLVDLAQKYRAGQLTLEQIEWWLKLRVEVRDRFMSPDFRAVSDGLSRIVAIEHLIDCDVAPFCPAGLTVAEESEQLPNRVRGKFPWNSASVRLHLSPNQQGGKHIDGKKLRKELEKERVYGAWLLDFYLAHPELIPDEWKGKAVFFWGTIYRSAVGRLYVRYLYWDGKRWSSHFGWLDDSFHDYSPAACSQV